MHLFQPRACHIYLPDGKKETIDTLLQGSNREIWAKRLSDEWDRLAQVNNNGVLTTDTIEFITQQVVPQGRDVGEN